MKYRVLAVLAASMLLLSGCGNKMTEVNSQTSGTDSAVSEQQGSTTGEGVTDADGSPVTGTGTAEGVDITDVKAQGGTTALNENAETQPFTPSADDDQEGAYGTAPADAANSGDSANPGDAAKPQEQSAPQKGNPNGKLFVTVQTVEVTLDQLKAQDYTVPLLINLDRNPGISYSEWGLQLDSRCTYTADNDGMDFSTVSFINDEKHFLWTAWTRGADIDHDTGSLLQLNVKLPLEAKAGDTYTITYADVSQANAPHIWTGGDTSWVAQNEVGWQDGGVIVK